MPPREFLRFSLMAILPSTWIMSLDRYSWYLNANAFYESSFKIYLPQDAHYNYDVQTHSHWEAPVLHLVTSGWFRLNNDLGFLLEDNGGKMSTNVCKCAKNHWWPKVSTDTPHEEAWFTSTTTYSFSTCPLSTSNNLVFDGGKKDKWHLIFPPKWMTF